MARSFKYFNANSLPDLKTAIDAFFTSLANTQIVLSLSLWANDEPGADGIEYEACLEYDVGGPALAAKFTVQFFSARNIIDLQSAVDTAIAAAPTELWFGLGCINPSSGFNGKLPSFQTAFLRNTSQLALRNISPILGSQERVIRNIGSAELNNSSQSISTTWTDVPGLTVTLNALIGSLIDVRFSGRASKATAGIGQFRLMVEGTAIGSTLREVTFGGGQMTVAADALVTVVASGAVIAKVQFQSDDANAVTIAYANLVAKELF